MEEIHSEVGVEDDGFAEIAEPRVRFVFEVRRVGAVIVGVVLLVALLTKDPLSL